MTPILIMLHTPRQGSEIPAQFLFNACLIYKVQPITEPQPDGCKARILVWPTMATSFEVIESVTDIEQIIEHKLSLLQFRMRA